MFSSVSSLIDSARSAREAVSEKLSLYKEPPHASGVRNLAKKYGSGTVAVADQNVSVTSCQPLKVQNGRLIDPEGRPVLLKGINVDGSMKLPVKPFLPSYVGDSTNSNDIFFDGDNVSFVGRPFPLEEAEEHFRRIKLWGFNTIRYLITWEALEHLGPGQYDQEFVDYTIEILKILHRVGGIYVFFECHQDVWSRFCGGSGAPMWTLYAAGIQPTRVSVTTAAVLHSDAQFDESSRSEPNCYPKMIWVSNYKRLALFTMFTLFFAGDAYFPDLRINGQNIQHYLQLQHMKALEFFWLAILKALPHMLEDGTILGFELLNEPNQGLTGHLHLGKLPENEHLKIGATPTVYDSLRMGMGLPVEVDVYKIAITGSQKCGRQVVDPAGLRLWLSAEEMTACDAKYGWKRSGWVPGECIYAQLGIWNYNSEELKVLADLPLNKRLAFATDQCQLNKPNFFNEDRDKFKAVLSEKGDWALPGPVNTEFFVNVCFVHFYVQFKEMVRRLAPTAFVLMQPLVLVIPPKLKDDIRQIIDDRTIYCPHYYDGMSLMFKSWNYRFNVDTLGIMRGRYVNPMFGVVLGETAIRNCIRKQFCAISKEGKDNLGNIPVLMSETGMPFDMNNKRSYRTGRYRSQTSALDALANALEGSDMHHTYWCYTSINEHKWGDHWNNEDFLFWSADDRGDTETGVVSGLLKKDDRQLVADTSTLGTESVRQPRDIFCARQLLKDRLKYHKKRLLSSVLYPDEQCETDDVESDTNTLISGYTSDNRSMISQRSTRHHKIHLRHCHASPDGLRAASAVIRPFLLTSPGIKQNSYFDIKTATFELTVKFDEDSVRSQPTIIFLPLWHYSNLTYSNVDVTSGYIELDSENEQLHWYIDSDDCTKHTIVIRRDKITPIEKPVTVCGGY